MAISKLAFLALLALSSLCGWANATYKVGVGRADITGPPVELSRGPWAIVLGCCSRGLDALLAASSMLFRNLRAWRITHNYAGGVL